MMKIVMIMPGTLPRILYQKLMSRQYYSLILTRSRALQVNRKMLDRSEVRQKMVQMPRADIKFSQVLQPTMHATQMLKTQQKCIQVDLNMLQAMVDKDEFPVNLCSKELCVPKHILWRAMKTAREMNNLADIALVDVHAAVRPATFPGLPRFFQK